MEKILILTKNILSERALQEKLQYLNYEVFCSTTQLEKLMGNNCTNFINEFPIVILSNTINTQELFQLLIPLKEATHTIIRKTAISPSLQEKKELVLLEVNGWLSEQDTIDQIRECLLTQKELLKEKINAGKCASQYIKVNEEFINKFTKREMKILKLLADKQGKIVSREEVCEFIWNCKPTNSNFSQLSVLIRKIKQNLSELGIEKTIIETVWKKGYRLNREFIYED